MKKVNWKKAIGIYALSFGISLIFFTVFCSAELPTALWYSTIGGAVLPILWRAWLESDPNDPAANAHFNAYLYDTDVATGRAIAEAEKLSGKSAFPDAQFNAHLYNTDLATGAMIAALENANKQQEKK